jgi:hypothetical protein
LAIPSDAHHPIVKKASVVRKVDTGGNVVDVGIAVEVVVRLLRAEVPVPYPLE